MILHGTRFGDVDYTEEDVLTFHDGLIGFSSITQFIIVSGKPESPFRWLQSVEQPALAFLVTDPATFIEDFAPEISLSTAAEMKLTEDTPRFLFATVNIPKGKPDEMTLNLAGPLVVNAQTREGRQIVLEDEAYTIRHRVFQRAERTSGQVAA